MPLPVSITIQGTYLKPDGSPETGRVSFRSNTTVRHSTSDDVMAPGVFTAVLDVTGSFSIEVPSSNDPEWNPSSWTYIVTERLSKHTRSFRAVVPYDAPGGVLELTDLLPSVGSSGNLYAPYAHTHPVTSITGTVAVLVLAQGEQIPPGTPPAVVFRTS